MSKDGSSITTPRRQARGPLRERDAAPAAGASRRTLLAAGGAVLAAGAGLVAGTGIAYATVATIPDAELPAARAGADAKLLAACKRFFRAHAVMEQFNAAGGGSDDESNAIVAEFHDASMAVAPLRATTAAGIKAKLEVAHLVAWSFQDCAIADEAWLAFSAIADLLGRSVVPNPDYGKEWALADADDALPFASPDADLLRLGADFLRHHACYSELVFAHSDVVDIPPEVMAAEWELIRHNKVLAERIAGLPATTSAGLRAKAAVLLTYIGHDAAGRPDWTSYDRFLGWSISRDLLGDSAVMSQGVPMPARRPASAGGRKPPRPPPATSQG